MKKSKKVDSLKSFLQKTFPSQYHSTLKENYSYLSAQTRVILRNHITELNSIKNNKEKLKDYAQLNKNENITAEYFEKCYWEIMHCYRTKFQDDYISREIAAFEQRMKEIQKRAMFDVLKKSTDQTHVPIDLINEKEREFLQTINLTLHELLSQLKDFNATISTILDSYDLETKKSLTPFILATIKAFNHNGYIHYMEIPENSPPPLIPARGSIKQDFLENISFKFFEMIHPITHHSGTGNVYVNRMYTEDKLFALICLQKALNINLFTQFKSDISLNDILQKTNKKEFASELISYIRSIAYSIEQKDGESNIFIKPADTITELKKSGWQIECTEEAELEYKSNIKLDAAICKAIETNAELKLMQNEFESQDAKKEFLKQSLKIFIKKNGTRTTQDATKQLFAIEVIAPPIYSAIVKSIEDRLQKACKCAPLHFTKRDLLDILQEHAKEASFCFSRINSDQFDALKKAGLIRKRNNLYTFINEYEKAIFWGEHFADLYDKESFQEFASSKKHINKSDCDSTNDSDRDDTNDGNRDSAPKTATKIVKQMLNFESLDNQSDHRTLNPISSIFFSLRLLSYCNRHLKEQTLKELCLQASNYNSKYRINQEIAVKILTYFLLYFGNDIPFTLKKEIFFAAFEKQLYPFQMPLYRELLAKDSFYEDFPQKAFQEALESHVSSNQEATRPKQPSFYLLQGLCRSNSQKPIEPESLREAIHLQDEIWIEHATEHQPKIKTMLQKQMSAIVSDMSRYENKNIPSSVIIGNNLCFLAFADLAEKERTPIEQLLKRIESQISPSDLLKAAISTDYFQRIKNPVYTDYVARNTPDNKTSPSDSSTATISKDHEDQNIQQDSILLICGAFRLINAYNFDDVKIKLDTDKTEEYKKYLTFEKANSRYFWFLIRLLSHVVDNNGNQVFSIENICEYKNTDIKTLKNNFPVADFLVYDNMSTFEDFLSEIRHNRTN